MTDIFKADGTTVTPDPTVTTPDAAVEAVKAKFKGDLDAIAKGKAEADSFIETLKREQAELRADLQKALNAEDQLAKLRQELEELRNATKAPTKDNTSPEFTEDSIRSIVSETITKEERNRTALQNVSAANSAMVEHFGSLDKAVEAVRTKAAEMGLTVEDFKQIAEKSPSAFQKMVLGDTKGASETGPLKVNGAPTTTVAPKGTPTPGTKEFFDEIRKADPRRYWDPKVQMAIHKAYEDGTYVI